MADNKNSCLCCLLLVFAFSDVKLGFSDAKLTNSHVDRWRRITISSDDMTVLQTMQASSLIECGHLCSADTECLAFSFDSTNCEIGTLEQVSSSPLDHQKKLVYQQGDMKKQVIFAGGLNDNGTVRDTVDAFDIDDFGNLIPLSKDLSAPKLPVPLAGFALVNLEDKVVLCGGVKSDQQASDKCFILDDMGVSWLATLTRMPTVLYNMAYAANGARMLLVGGQETSNFKTRAAKLLKFAQNPLGFWGTRSSAPTLADRGSCLVQINSEVSLRIGGDYHGRGTSLYHWKNDSWSSLPDMPLAVQDPASPCQFNMECCNTGIKC